MNTNTESELRSPEFSGEDLRDIQTMETSSDPKERVEAAAQFLYRHEPSSLSKRGLEEAAMVSLNRKKQREQLLPNVGDEALVDICPCPQGDGVTWMQVGKVLKLWPMVEHGITTTHAEIEIIRKLTDEENDRYQSDDSWNGCVFVCCFNERLNDWRALSACNDLALELFGGKDADRDAANCDCEPVQVPEITDGSPEDHEAPEVELCIECGDVCDMSIGGEGHRCMDCGGAFCNCECENVHQCDEWDEHD